MADPRLTQAIDADMVVIPQAGEIAVFHPVTSMDLSALPKERLQLIQGFYPDHQAFKARGYNVALELKTPCSAALVFLPRSKRQARATVARALDITGGGPVFIDGQKTDGIAGILKDCRARGGDIGPVFSKAHGKIFTLTGGDFSDWAGGEPTEVAGGFFTRAGVFSADGIDRGSAVLAAALPADLSGKVADLGAGWGYLSRHISQRENVSACHLIEADHDALDCARVNVTDPRAQFHWADARDFSAIQGFDHIITNPPFHTSRAADPELGRAFITTAARLLTRQGVLWLVANRHLPYEQHLSKAFSEVREVSGDKSFKIFRATKPRVQQT